MRPPAAVVAIPSLGVALVGCSACRCVLGTAGAAGLDERLAAHTTQCPNRPPQPAPTRPGRPEVCPRCGCEAELSACLGGAWRCGDCLAEALLDDLDLPVVLTPAPLARIPRRRRRRRPVGPAPAVTPRPAPHIPEAPW